MNIQEWPRDILTRFEVARIVGARTLQISLGAPLLVKEQKDVTNPIKLAEEEFVAGKVPMTVRRTMPSGEKIVIDIKTSVKNWLDEHNGGIY